MHEKLYDQCSNSIFKVGLALCRTKAISSLEINFHLLRESVAPLKMMLFWCLQMAQQFTISISLEILEPKALRASTIISKHGKLWS